MTFKEEKYIKLRQKTNEAAVGAWTSSIQNFISFSAHFLSVQLYFIEIPPYSIVEWNKNKGHPTPLDYKAQDILENYISK